MVAGRATQVLGPLWSFHLFGKAIIRSAEVATNVRRILIPSRKIGSRHPGARSAVILGRVEGWARRTRMRWVTEN